MTDQLDIVLAETGPIIESLAPKLPAAQAAGRVPQGLAPRACVATLLLMLERLSAIGPLGPANGSLPGFDTLKDAAAHTVASMLGAHP
ncbi:MAG: hypothetical protein Q8R44_20310 [Novosphingobium sp.]|nr:hypothetical protein [Novosphingobium sp.]